MQVSAWSRVVLTRSVALAPTLLVAVISRVPNQLDHLNQWLNILQSIQLPFAVVPVRPSRASIPVTHGALHRFSAIPLNG